MKSVKSETISDNVENNSVKNSDSESVLEDKDYFLKQGIMFQKRRVYIIGPLMLFITAGSYVWTQAWQLGVNSVIMLMTNVIFWIALAEVKKHNLYRSMWLALFGTLAIGAGVILLINGLETALILTAIAVVVQMSVFSNRISFVGSCAVFVFIVLDKFLNCFNLYHRFTVEPVLEFSTAILIGFIMIVQFWVYLKKHKDNYSYFLLRAEKMNRKQQKIISTVSDTIPQVNNTLIEITGVSKDVSEKAESQALSMLDMSTIVQQMMSGSAQTSSAAKQTSHIALSTRRELEQNAERIVDAEKMFDNVQHHIDDTVVLMQDLLDKTEQIESVLAYNRDIGEHIKVLSVNASIEAAEAGESGLGFGVVAKELRDMIESTEGNLFTSQKILHDIRERSQKGMMAIEQSSSLLKDFYGELKRVADTISRSVQSFAETSSQVKHISDASEEQKLSLKNVSSSVLVLQKAASELAMSSRQLGNSVDSMEDMRNTLSTALK